MGLPVAGQFPETLMQLARPSGLPRACDHCNDELDRHCEERIDVPHPTPSLRGA